MLNRTVLFLLALALALLASPGLAPPVAAAGPLVVDDDLDPCEPTGMIYMHIAGALMDAAPGDTIRVCEGVYPEQPVITVDGLTITGPGATPENDGVATVHHAGGSSATIFIQANGVTLEGLDLDATPPGGYVGDTSGIESSGDYVTIQDNEIRNATSSAVSASGSNVNVLRNNVHDNGSGISCNCDDSGLWSNTIDGGGSTALTLHGDSGTIGGNVVTNGGVTAIGNDIAVQNNRLSAGTASSTLYVSGNSVTVTGNDLSDADYYGVEATPQSALSTSVTIARNTFTQIRVPIHLSDSDPSDGFGLAATIGGSPSEANTFIDSGGALGDMNYLVEMDGPTANVNAEYNKWGLCTAAEIEQEIYHQPDDANQGLVDFEPFIPPSSCSAATPTPTATPPPGGRVITIPPGKWANFAWTGDNPPQDVADCFAGGGISVMYRLDAASGSFQRWVRGRPDVSNMGQVAQYDPLLALNGSSQEASCTPPPVMLLGRTVTIPANRWANFAWSGNLTLPPQEVADCFAGGNIAVMYRLDAASGSFQRWIRGRPELTTMGNIAPFDAILGLNAGSQDGICDIPILVT